MKIPILKNADIKNKKVLVRVDFNVPMKNGIISDDTKLKAVIPTINYLLENDCKIILISHFGRPEELIKKGISPEKVKKDLSLKPVAEKFSILIKTKVGFAEDCINIVPPKDRIVLLENLRFHAEEEKNDKNFAKKLSLSAEVYVNDAFGASHRYHASIDAITRFLPSYAGFLLEREATELGKLLNPEKPFIAIIGGSKADKIGVINTILPYVDNLIVGGVLANTFLKAKNFDIKASKFDKESLEFAKGLINDKKIVLPEDVVVSEKFEDNAESKEVSFDKIPDNWMIMDIGSRTINLYKVLLSNAKTILWAGPLGVFEFKKFENGTKEIAEFISSLKAIKIIGGGDSAAAVEKFKLSGKMSHVSTGGGASLEFIEKHGNLPGLIALENCEKKSKKLCR